jgi:AraC-like DNA-binding protein
MRVPVGHQFHVNVALELGYSDQSHMTQALKAIMGWTPGTIKAAAPTT